MTAKYELITVTGMKQYVQDYTANFATQSQLFSGSYNDLSSVPSQFPPAPHNHDGRYYTKTESDNRYARAGQGGKVKSVTLKSPPTANIEHIELEIY